jgi:hypothetical protein
MGWNINQIPQAVKDKLGIKDIAYKQFWAIVGDSKPIYFRSSWEYYYSLFLEKLKQDGKIIKWEHEPHCFWFEKIKRGVRSYLPDYRVTHLDGKIEYVECKGYMDDKSKTKMKRMALYHPLVNIRLVDKEWFLKNLKSLKALEPLYAKKLAKNELGK